VSILVKTFKQKIDFAYTGYFHANVHAQPWQEVHPKPLTLENIKKNDCAAGGALAFRKTIPVRFREYMKVNEDQAFLFDLYKSKLRYALVDIPTFNYRLLPTGMSYSRKEEVEQSTKELIREIEDYEAQNLGS
jgi:bifunctional DNA-binding transcriptional regulator/antitoxin component of YhaV-PrlF toxin-antitoxin module